MLIFKKNFDILSSAVIILRLNRDQVNQKNQLQPYSLAIMLWLLAEVSLCHIVNGPVVYPKNFKRLCMGGQSTPMFSIKYSRQLVADCYKSFTILYSNSS